MEIILLGVRGSIPSPSQTTQFYGANTSCVEMRTKSGELLIFDAGSGLRLLGDTLPEHGECHLFLTHLHNDHTVGLGFFKPFFKPGWVINLYLPDGHQSFLQRYFNGDTFPVQHECLRAAINIISVTPGQTIAIKPSGEPISVQTFPTEHPGGNIAYKVVADNTTFLYSGDHEITTDPAVRALTEKMLCGADLALVDASYCRSSYVSGWGHSAWEDWVEIADKSGVSCLALSHHAPERTDEELDALQSELLKRPQGAASVRVAREGMRFCPDSGIQPKIHTSGWLQDFIDMIGQYREESVILDSILKKTREISSADAGTVFLLDGNEMVFSYTHNDSLFPANESSKYAYASIRMPCTTESIAGYCAVTGKSLNLPNVRNLPEDAPYRFNESFDKKTGYRTESILTIPLVGKNKRMLGVMQLINSLNPRTLQPQPFTPLMERTVKILAMEASKVLEISSTITDNIYRLLRIASLHDPMETGPHAERVGAVAAEIYQVWALRHGINPDEALSFRSNLRLAAMLHDIGKVGISDTVLKKPGKLSADEFDIIKTHTEKGSALFDYQFQDISDLASDIALHHHQRWDGAGYGQLGKTPLKGKDIPLAARITAIADVFDALVSPRCYKEPWPFDKAVLQIRNDAGSHFDPELSDCFASILDTVYMIYQRFPENLSCSFFVSCNTNSTS